MPADNSLVRGIPVGDKARGLISLYKSSSIEINAFDDCANIPKCIQNPFHFHQTLKNVKDYRSNSLLIQFLINFGFEFLSEACS